MHATEHPRTTDHRVPASVKPDWIRIDDAVRLYSISRTGLYEMVREGKIKSVVLKKKQNIRGIRLLSTASLDALMESLAEEAAKELQAA